MTHFHASCMILCSLRIWVNVSLTKSMFAWSKPAHDFGDTSDQVAIDHDLLDAMETISSKKSLAVCKVCSSVSVPWIPSARKARGFLSWAKAWAIVCAHSRQDQSACKATLVSRLFVASIKIKCSRFKGIRAKNILGKLDWRQDKFMYCIWYIYIYNKLCSQVLSFRPTPQKPHLM